jgi:hypothetical protein
MECALPTQGRRQHIHLGQFMGGVTMFAIVVLLGEEEAEEEE